MLEAIIIRGRQKQAVLTGLNLRTNLRVGIDGAMKFGSPVEFEEPVYAKKIIVDELEFKVMRPKSD